MARRPRRLKSEATFGTTKPASNATADQVKTDNPAMEALIKEINALCTPDALTVETTAPTVFQVKLSNGEFRTKTLNGNTEFLFIGVRAGARGLIFEFKPFDGEYAQAELAASKAAEVFPELREFLKPVLGEFTNLDAAIAHHHLKETKRLAALKKEAENIAKQELKDTYQNNPTWGLF